MITLKARHLDTGIELQFLSGADEYRRLSNRRRATILHNALRYISRQPSLHRSDTLSFCRRCRSILSVRHIVGGHKWAICPKPGCRGAGYIR